MPATLLENHYGKSDVRLTKIIRKGDRHELLEFSVDVQLSGDFARSYTHGDNTSVIATDSMKNTVYVLAKQRDFACAEEFAILLAEHFPKTYAQVSSAFVEIRQTNWDRILVNAKPHDHAFIDGGRGLRTATAVATKTGVINISGGVSDLLILKTTRSAFRDFVTDKYRTLKDAEDRIFATRLTADWDFTAPVADFTKARERIIQSMLDVFAGNMSYAVQQTMFQMGEAALAVAPEIHRIALHMPNKHRIPINLEPFGLTNHNEIFVWTDEPSGDIRATVQRAAEGRAS